MEIPLLEGESDWLASVVDDLTNDDLKLVYADWLEERGDPRGVFLRQFAKAARTLRRSDFPEPRAIPEEWLELIGFRLVEGVSHVGSPSIKEPLLRLARPALRLTEHVFSDAEIPVGATKVGGKPDLPADFRWPTGNDCRAGYGRGAAGYAQLAGFLGQISFGEIAGTQATRGLPQQGVLTFFSFQDMAHRLPEALGRSSSPTRRGCAARPRPAD
jgi:uncharacterized protein (TIGR02996 family)